jgi:hypothetical protein
MKKIKKSNLSQRSFILSVSMFLLGREEMRNLVWTVESVKYDKINQIVNIGINTTSGKLGTTLTQLRKTCKELAAYLKEYSLTFKTAQIKFFVDKNEEKLQNMNEYLDNFAGDTEMVEVS